MKTYQEWTINNAVFRGYEDRVSDHVIVFFHGYTGHKAESGRLFYHLSEQLTKQGISTIRFDWFGHGESDMEFVDIRVPMLQAQANMVLDYALEHYQSVTLLGFSMGGAFAMHHVRNSIDKLILLAPAFMMSGMKKHQFDGVEGDTMDLGGIVLHKEFLAGFEHMTMLENTKQYQGPILILQGEEDQAVPPRLAKYLKEEVPHSILELYPGSDHCFHNRETHTILGDRIIQFMNE